MPARPIRIDSPRVGPAISGIRARRFFRLKSEVEAWMTLPAAEALALQRPLPDGSLKIVARGAKQDL